MAELLLELYSEEIPPKLHISARNQLKLIVKKSFDEKSLKYKDIKIFSSPTRLILNITDLPEKIKIFGEELKKIGLV